MNRVGGFTLVELVAVLLVLALLAMFAIPRYLAVQGEARKTTVLGIEGAINSAVALVKARAKLEGKSVSADTYGSITLERGLGETITVWITPQLLPWGTIEGIGGKAPFEDGALDLRDLEDKLEVTETHPWWYVPGPWSMIYAAKGAPGTCQVVYTEYGVESGAPIGRVTIETDVTGC